MADDPDRLAACPVCPFRGLVAADLRCPSCGTDLTALRRVQELPLAVLDDALRALEAGDRSAALAHAQAATAFARSRPRALLVLGDMRARLGDLPGAVEAWRAAARLGLRGEARDRIRYLAGLSFGARLRLAGRRLRRSLASRAAGPRRRPRVRRQRARRSTIAP